MPEPVDIGTRLELFVDDLLIDTLQSVRVELHRPEQREVAFVSDAPWEDEVSNYHSLVQDGKTVRLYYRASFPDRGNEALAAYALAESTDGGRTFTRPGLGLVEYQGSKDNNLLAIGEPPFVPPPAFIDTNPDCNPEERYKGLAHHWKKLYAMASPDGIHWHPMSEQPLDMVGTFDTVNTAFWDARTNCYRCFTRYFKNLTDDMNADDVLGIRPTAIRAIQSATFTDFLHWSPAVPNQYDDPHDDMQLYTNATIPCPGAGAIPGAIPGVEHIYLSFPNRYVQQRMIDPAHKIPGVNDALLMVSRDGVHWKRYLEAYVRPGLDQLNWTERNNYPIWHLIETSPTEWSMYINQHYRHPGTRPQLRRLAIRPHGFVSIRGDYAGGEMITKPLIYAGKTLHLNYATSAAGSIRVEIQDMQGRSLPGFGLTQMQPLFGDQLDGPVRWKTRETLAELIGQPVRFRFVLSDADLFALRTV